jgi:hypothetical protein
VVAVGRSHPVLSGFPTHAIARSLLLPQVTPAASKIAERHGLFNSTQR